MRIDAHQHFWDYSADPEAFAWISDEHASLRRNFGPAELEPLLQQNRMDGCIAIEARASIRETDFLLDLAARHKLILGVVGWLDLAAPDIADTTSHYAANAMFKGIRTQMFTGDTLQSIWSTQHLVGIKQLSHHGLSCDLLIRPHHLAAAIQLADLLPNQVFVVNHLAKPAIAAGQLEPWAAQLRSLAERPNVSCKLSSHITQSRLPDWSAANIRPFLDHALECFGASRLMAASDWPVCTIAADYGTTLSVLENWAGQLSLEERAAVFGDNCRTTYRI